MRVEAEAADRVFGKAVSEVFSDMDANGEHGLALTLIALALDEVRAQTPEYAAAITAVLDRAEVLVNRYIQRETPVEYV